MEDRFGETFYNVEGVDSLIDSFPLRVFEGEIPNIPGLEYGIETVKDHSHVNERIAEELSICTRDVAMLFFPKKLFFASPDVRDDGI